MMFEASLLPRSSAAATERRGVVSVPPGWVRNVALQTSGRGYLPEDNPFNTVFADITHRCNMNCKNCYIPNRDVPDMPPEWLFDILRRLPRRTRIRLVGAEPTMRKDLTELIRGTRALGHVPVVLTNGLRLVNRRYVDSLKRAGLRTVYLSCNGGLDDDLYEAIDDLRCAAKKRRALENLAAANMNITVGMILVRGVNVHHWPAFFEHLRALPQVSEIHLRSIGEFGRHMKAPPLTMPTLVQIALAADREGVVRVQSERQAELMLGGKRVQLRQWPELGSAERGRITPSGLIEPCFEHLIANQGGY